MGQKCSLVQPCKIRQSAFMDISGYLIICSELFYRCYKSGLISFSKEYLRRAVSHLNFCFIRLRISYDDGVRHYQTLVVYIKFP